MFIPINRGTIKDNIQEYIINAKEEYKWTLQEIKHQLYTIKKAQLTLESKQYNTRNAFTSILTSLY